MILLESLSACHGRPVRLDAHQILAYSREVFVNLNTMLFKVTGGSDTAQHQKLWGTKRASAEDDFPFGQNCFPLCSIARDDLYPFGK